nr:VWA-like domain-containing protein [Lachnospiraceae bacterium]
DYSFCPPDKRYGDSDFFLPDFNEKDDKIEKILFMIDTSGSMSDHEIRRCYSEIKGAIDQFNGKLEGWLGFFDAAVTEPQLFSDEEEFLVIHPVGGGGTSFEVIFEYVRDHMEADPPVSIVILTDGYAPFPDRSKTMGIPVLWIINNEKVTPPWGKIARIK